MYEAEEEPTLRSDSDDANGDYGDAILDSTTSSTLTVIHQQQDSLDDVNDINDQSSKAANGVISDIASERKGKKVYRR